MNCLSLLRRPKRGRLLAPSLAIVMCLTGSAASAQSRWVVVNGQRMSDAQAAELDRLQCVVVPNGSYWLNPRTRAWGYAGNPRVQGVLGEHCARGAGPTGGTNLDGTHGPFASMRRAEEEAAKYRAQGYRAVAFHNGDGYYVRVSR
jgi:hypothetical protein